MILLINPKLVVQKNDTFTTGIIYMPVGLATFAGGLKKLGISHQVLDLFGLNPTKNIDLDERWAFGENLETALIKLVAAPSLIIIYANQAANHSEIILIIEQTLKLYPDAPIYILENSQAVTAYSLESVKNHFEKYEIAGLISGSPEMQVNFFVNKILNINKTISDPSADWENFPLENYWKYKLAHGPQTNAKYLPILTSYGCPWACSFCVVPATNKRKWTGRQSESVYREILELKSKYNVNEFHVEDLNSSVNTNRLLELADKIQSLSIIWKIVAGTKAETLDSFDTLKKLHNSGLRYFSFSPESGSNRVKQEIGKRFENKHSFRLIRWSRKLDIKTQACFILGMPNERVIDRFRSLTLIRVYSIIGVDEIAVFIISPMPGAKIYNSFEVDIQNISFSPSWRRDYKKLTFIRIYWYLNFLILKILFHPFKFVDSIIRFFDRNFELKMELAPHRSRQWKRWAKKQPGDS
jgi:radical SAM superfamily enzyme YgiQ (UPF0313 family)